MLGHIDNPAVSATFPMSLAGHLRHCPVLVGLLLIMLSIGLTACATVRRGVSGPAPYPSGYPPRDVPPTSPVGSVVVTSPEGLPTQLHIPAGHLPPPGSCRIWYPDRPAGQQPPPGDCRDLAQRVPPGAWLLTRPADAAEHVHVAAYDPQHAEAMRVVRVFEAATGKYVRDLERRKGERK